MQVSKLGVPGNRLTAGVGFLYIPKDLAREKFVTACYKNGTVSFVTEHGERFDNVKVSKNLFKELEFPDSTDVLGSEVFWVLTPKYKQPVIVGILMRNGEFLNLAEGQFLLSKKTSAGYVEVFGSVKDGSNLVLKLESEIPNGKILIASTSRDNSGEIELYADGKTKIDSSGQVEVHSSQEVLMDVTDYENTPNDQLSLSLSKDNGFTYTDAFSNRISCDKDGTITLFPAVKLMIQEGTEPIPLGTTLKENLNKEKSVLTDLLDTLKNVTPVSVVSGSPDATWSALILQLQTIVNRGDYSNINSEVSFTK